MNRDAKIYVAGHAGLVGGAIMRSLEAASYTNIVTRTRQELDLLDQHKVRIFFETEKPEYVIYAAGRVGGIKANMTYPADFLFENLQMQNNIIWSAFQTDVKKFLFLGSSCIYPAASPQPMKEEYLLTGAVEPTNEGYAIAKIAGLKMCEKIYEQFSRNFISCMPTNIYGPRDNFGSETSHVIPSLITRLYEAKITNASEVLIWGSGVSRREFLYVDDLADAVVWLMNNYNDREFINIGTGSDVSVRELAEQIKSIVGYEGQLVFDTTKPDGMPKKRLDVTKASELGWMAKTQLDDGLKTTFDWFLSNYANSRK